VSAVICSHDRRADLLDAIRSLSGQTLPRDQYEVVVVDNASTDGSEDAVRELAEEFPVPLAVVAEPRLGVAHARNAGIAAAQGDIVAFIDSDALAEEPWLAGLVAAFDDPAVVCAGGPVRLRFEGGRPRGLPEVAQLRLSACDQGPIARDIRSPAWLCGANIAFRRDVLASLGGFRAELGRRGGRPASGEETELCLRIERSGGRIRWVPGAVVHHRIRPSRLRLLAILRRSYWEGFSYGQIHAWHEEAASQESSVRRQMAGLQAECRRAPLLRRQAVLPAILAQRLRGQLDGYGAASGAELAPSERRERRRMFRFVRETRRRSLAAGALRRVHGWLRAFTSLRSSLASVDGGPDSGDRDAER